jgi:hypothetical protein
MCRMYLYVVSQSFHSSVQLGPVVLDMTFGLSVQVNDESQQFKIQNKFVLAIMVWYMFK